MSTMSICSSFCGAALSKISAARCTADSWVSMKILMVGAARADLFGSGGDAPVQQALHHAEKREAPHIFVERREKPAIGKLPVEIGSR